MNPEHPTALELRFEHELEAAVPGWKGELAKPCGAGDEPAEDGR